MKVRYVRRFGNVGVKSPDWDRIVIEMIEEGYEEIKGLLVRLYKGWFSK